MKGSSKKTFCCLFRALTTQVSKLRSRSKLGTIAKTSRGSAEAVGLTQARSRDPYLTPNSYSSTGNGWDGRTSNPAHSLSRWK